MSAPDLEELQRHRHALEAGAGAPTVAICGGIDERMVAVVQRLLGRRDAGPLHLVLCTRGGIMAPARKLAHLLRRRADPLRVYVPQAAHSAGTLLAVAADEIVFGDLGELGPLDPQMNSAAPGSGGPNQLSSEDLRRFADVARDWFGVDAASDGVTLVGLLSQQVFPPTLTTAYRLDQAVVRAATELLDRQLPGSSPDDRRRVARALVSAGLHDEGILPHDAEALGLRVRHADDREQACLTAFTDVADQLLDPSGPQGGDVLGVVAGPGFEACAVRTATGNGPVLRWRWHAR